MPTDTYETRYVAFIDILGFSAQVRRGSSPERLADALEEIASEMTQPATAEPAIDFKSQTFSDCIALSVAANSQGLKYLLARIETHTLKMLSIGILTRGGVSKGQLYHSPKVVFGPAFLNAYRLESSIAAYPRVLVDRQTHEDLSKHDPSQDLVKRGQDGPAFVDIFRQFYPPPTRPVWNADKVKLYRDCVRTIEEGMRETTDEPAHYAKVKWLAERMNATIMMYMIGNGPFEGFSQVRLPQ